MLFPSGSSRLILYLSYILRWYEKLKYETIMSVKELVRTGWMLRGIPSCVAETVASHTFEVIFLSMIISDRLKRNGVNVDVEKVLRMSILHDIPEAITGDIVKWTKENLVSLDIDKIALQELGLSNYRDLIVDLLELKSLESEIVKFSDYLATLLQAKRYFRLGYRRVDEIIRSSEEVIKHMENYLPKLSKYKNTINSLYGELISSE